MVFDSIQTSTPFYIHSISIPKQLCKKPYPKCKFHVNNSSYFQHMWVNQPTKFRKHESNTNVQVRVNRKRYESTKLSHYHIHSPFSSNCNAGDIFYQTHVFTTITFLLLPLFIWSILRDACFRYFLGMIKYIVFEL